MKGKKIRVMQSDTMIKMLCMGGKLVYQWAKVKLTPQYNKVLDGAENNEITYADLKQYEVVPYFLLPSPNGSRPSSSKQLLPVNYV